MFHLSADALNDAEFLSSNPVSRLSTLFMDDSSNMIADLKYVAPKQPQKDLDHSNGTDVKASNLVVLYASAISLFCHDQDTLKNFGKAMCCITKDMTDVFALLIYKTKQQIISQTIIHENFNVTLQPNNFAVFTDDKNIQRSIHISSNYEHFLTQIGICCAFLAFKKRCELSYFTQDISLGEGELIEDGNTIKISLNSWLVENFKRGIQLGNQKDGIKLTLSKTSKSWEMGLVGGQVFLRRIIFVPNSQVYAADESSMIAYEVLIEKNYKNDDDKEFPLVKPSNADLKGFDEVKKIFPPTSPSKASLISRMAKVGQALLPTVPSLHHLVALTDSESEIEDINDSKSIGEMSDSTEESKAKLSQVKFKCEKINKKFNSDNKHQPCKAPTLASFNLHQEDYVPESNRPAGFSGLAQSFCSQYSSLPPGSLVSYHPMSLPHSYQGQHGFSSSMESILSLLLSESRSQNTDTRITLSKLTEKIDQLAAKINVVDGQGLASHHSTALYQIPFTHSKFDPKELLFQITTIVQDNEELKQEINKINKRNEELNYDYAEVMKKNQSLLEEKTELLTQKKGSGSPDKTRISLLEVLTIQEEKVKIKARLEDAMKVIKSLENENNNSKDSHLIYEQSMDSLRANLEEEKKARSTLEEKLKLQDKELSSLEANVKDLKESCSKLTSSIVDQGVLINNSNLQNDELEQMVKLKEEEIRMLISENVDYKKKVLDLEDMCKQLHLDRMSSVDDSTMKDTELSTLVKQIMNATYKKLKGLFNIAETYEGKQVLEKILEVIRDTTLQYVEKRENSSALQFKENSNPAEKSIPIIKKQKEREAKDSTGDTVGAYQRMPYSERSEIDSRLIQAYKAEECVPIVYEEDCNIPSLKLLPELEETDLDTDTAPLDNFNSLKKPTEESVSPNLQVTNDGGCPLSVSIENTVPSMPPTPNDPSNSEQILCKSSSNNLPSTKCVDIDGVSSNKSAQNGDTKLNKMEEKGTSKLSDVDDLNKIPVIELPNETFVTVTELPTSQISENTEDWRPIPPPVPSLFSDSDEDDDNWLP